MELKLKDHYMQICGKKKLNDDFDDSNSDDTESNAEELETHDGFVGTNIESQARVVTLRSRDTDSLVTVSDI